MPDEFVPNASVDFEAIAAEAAAAVNGDAPHYTPPAEQPDRPAPPVRPRARASDDPFAVLDQLIGEQSLMFRELGDINSKLGTLQLQTILMFGSAMLLAVLVWKFAHAKAP